MFSFFINKSNKHIKQFNFSPRYYNESKEEMEERYRRIKAELEGESTLRTGSHGISLKDKWLRNKNTSNFEKKSSVRLVFIVLLLLALCYFILYY